MVSDNKNSSFGNVESFKTLIKNIAQCHACEIRNFENDGKQSDCGINIEEIGAKLLSLDLFEALDKAAARQQLKLLNDSVNKSFESDVLVKDLGIHKPVPLPYEVLRLIFAQTNEKFRQKHFHELIDFYYEELCRVLKKIGSAYVLPRPKFDALLKLLLPVVKFETLFKIVDDGGPERKELVKNISNYFKYPRINQEDMYAAIKSKLGSDDFNLKSYDFIPLEEVNGHLGHYFTVKVDLGVERLKLFAKFMTSSEILQNFLERGPFKKEEFFYLEFIPKMEQLGLPKQFRDFAPNCHFSRVDDVLILDDLFASGYTGLTPNQKLEVDALRLAVRGLAKIHACSIFLEEREKVSLGEVYSEFLKEILFDPGNHQSSKEMHDSVPATIMFLVSQFPDVTEKYTKDELEAKIDRGWGTLREKVKSSREFRNVICHGDLHVSNMMFKIDGNRACHGVIFIDFQILRYCPPALDLLFLLQQNAFKNTLDAHKDELIEDYYTEISTILEKCDIDVTKVFPRHNFDESIKYIKSAALFQTFWYSQMMMLNPKFREELFKDEEKLKIFKEDKFYFAKIGLQNEDFKEVFKGLTESLVELCDSGDI